MSNKKVAVTFVLKAQPEVKASGLYPSDTQVCSLVEKALEKLELKDEPSSFFFTQEENEIDMTAKLDQFASLKVKLFLCKKISRILPTLLSCYVKVEDEELILLKDINPEESLFQLRERILGARGSDPGEYSIMIDEIEFFENLKISDIKNLREDSIISYKKGASSDISIFYCLEDEEPSALECKNNITFEKLKTLIEADASVKLENIYFASESTIFDSMKKLSFYKNLEEEIIYIKKIFIGLKLLVNEKVTIVEISRFETVLDLKSKIKIMLKLPDEASIQIINGDNVILQDEESIKNLTKKADQCLKVETKNQETQIFSFSLMKKERCSDIKMSLNKNEKISSLMEKIQLEHNILIADQKWEVDSRFAIHGDETSIFDFVAGDSSKKIKIFEIQGPHIRSYKFGFDSKVIEHEVLLTSNINKLKEDLSRIFQFEEGSLLKIENRDIDDQRLNFYELDEKEKIIALYTRVNFTVSYEEKQMLISFMLNSKKEVKELKFLLAQEKGLPGAEYQEWQFNGEILSDEKLLDFGFFRSSPTISVVRRIFEQEVCIQLNMFYKDGNKSNFEKKASNFVTVESILKEIKIIQNSEPTFCIEYNSKSYPISMKISEFVSDYSPEKIQIDIYQQLIFKLKFCNRKHKVKLFLNQTLNDLKLEILKENGCEDKINKVSFPDNIKNIENKKIFDIVADIKSLDSVYLIKMIDLRINISGEWHQHKINDSTSLNDLKDKIPSFDLNNQINHQFLVNQKPLSEKEFQSLLDNPECFEIDLKLMILKDLKIFFNKETHKIEVDDEESILNLKLILKKKFNINKPFELFESTGKLSDQILIKSLKASKLALVLNAKIIHKEQAIFLNCYDKVSMIKITFNQILKIDCLDKMIIYKNQILNEEKILKEYDILEQDYEIDFCPKIKVKIEYLTKSFDVECTHQINYESLLEGVSKEFALKKDKYFVLLYENDKFIEILSKSYPIEKLNSNYNIQIRSKEEYQIIDHTKKSTLFVSFKNAELSHHKEKYFIDYKLPPNHQSWKVKEAEKKFIEIKPDERLEDFESDSFVVDKKFTLNLCYNLVVHELPNNMGSETIGDIKTKISSIYNTQVSDLQLFYKDKEMYNDKLLRTFDSEAYLLPVDVVIKNDLEFYGFDHSEEIGFSLLKNFFIESDEDLTQIIKETDFNKAEGQISFRNKLLGFFFGAIKRHSLWDGIIDKIKSLVVRHKNAEIWVNTNESNTDIKSKFNSQFLIHYMLNSGDLRLNSQIISLMKNHHPIPLVIKKWTKRQTPQDSRKVQEVGLVVQKAWTITSIGMSTAGKRICGKSSLLNLLFFTNFNIASERNMICSECPEVYFDIFKNDKYSVNLIDIPSNASEKYANQLLDLSDLLIISILKEDFKDDDVEKLKAMYKIPIVLIIKDVKNAFTQLSKFKESLNHSFEEGMKSNFFVIEIEDLSNYERNKNRIEEFIEKVQEFTLNKLIKSPHHKKSLNFTKFFDDNVQKFDEVMMKIEEESIKLCQNIKLFTEIKELDDKDGLTMDVIEKCKNEIKAKVNKNQLSETLKKCLRVLHDYAKKNSCYIEILLLRLQNFLRLMKNEQTNKYYKFYDSKSEISKDDLQTEEYKLICSNLQEYWKDIEKDNFYCELKFPELKDKEEVQKFINTCILTFEHKIMVQIFSIELFWREIIYTNELIPDLSIESQDGSKKIKLENSLVKLKKKNIEDGLPFELIDGDILHMPKEFLKKVFKDFNENVVVVSILGPQSSGKSTLLNFLFGCDFSTSSGRCTKGIYGTFIRLNNLNSVGGLLLLDTEGLFGLLNEVETKQRDRFERKLVLFCFAVSDIVLINFRGDIDKNLTELMMVTKDSLKKLNEGNNILPELYLILNQNAQTNKESHLSDIDKISTLYKFPRDNVKVLPLAYSTKEKKIKGIDPITKKEPKDDFSTKCSQLSAEIFDKIATKGRKERTMEEVFDEIDKLWELMNNYPSLLKYNTLQDQEVDTMIRNWIREKVDNKLSQSFHDKFKQLVNDPKLSIESLNQTMSNFMNEESGKVVTEFKREFEKHSNDFPNLYGDIENFMHSSINRLKSDMSVEIFNFNHKKKSAQSDQEGNELVKEAIDLYKKHPKNYEGSKKLELFDSKWSIIIKKITSAFDRKTESEKLLKCVKEYYSCYLGNSTGIPANPVFDHNLINREFDLKSLREYLVQKLVTNYKNTNHKFADVKTPPINVFGGGKINIPFRYFDLRTYFQKSKKKEFLILEKRELVRILDRNRISDEFCNIMNNLNANLIKRISKEIVNEYLLFNLKAKEKTVEDYIIYLQRNFFSRLLHHTPQIYFEASNDPKFPPENTNFKYLNKSMIIECLNIRERISGATFFGKVRKALSDDAIYTYLSKDYDFKNSEISKLADRIQRELAEINIKAPSLDKIIYELPKSGFETEAFSVYFEEIQNENFTYNHNFEFKYISKSQLIRYQNWSPNKDENNIHISTRELDRKTPLDAFKSISWMDAYANQTYDKYYKNSTKFNDLITQVSKDFNFSGLINDVFDLAESKILHNNMHNSLKMYQEICSGVNDLISLAQSDLQQVSLKLEVGVVSSIHLSVCTLIWIYFESQSWGKVFAPITKIINSKESQYKYFEAMTNDDQFLINESLAAKFVDRFIDFIQEDLVKNIKAKFKIQSSQKFNSSVNRADIQSQIDEKLFSVSSSISREDLYQYITNPKQLIQDAYTKELENHIKDAKSNIVQESSKIIMKIGDFKYHVDSLKSKFGKFNDDDFSIDNLFKPKIYNQDSMNEVFYSKYNTELKRKANLQLILALWRGDSDIFNPNFEIKLNDSTSVGTKKHHDFNLNPFEHEDIIQIVERQLLALEDISNICMFIKFLAEKLEVAKILEKIEKFFEWNQDDENEFQNQTAFFVCSQLCPFCERICGETNSSHETHRCLFGHQMRAIGGIKLNNNEASVIRCEDVEDNDIVLFNGVEKSWRGLKEEYANGPIKWSFDDLKHTRNDQKLIERFRFAWRQIGEELCNTKWKNMKIQYVEYNQANLERQKKIMTNERSYIFVIDSSGNIYILA